MLFNQVHLVDVIWCLGLGDVEAFRHLHENRASRALFQPVVEANLTEVLIELEIVGKFG